MTTNEIVDSLGNYGLDDWLRNDPVNNVTDPLGKILVRKLLAARDDFLEYLITSEDIDPENAELLEEIW